MATTSHQVVWARCSVTNPETGEDTILNQGDMLPDWVSEFTRFVLVSTGGVRVVADPDPALLAALPEPVRLQEHPDLPVGLTGVGVLDEQREAERKAREARAAAEAEAEAGAGEAGEPAPPRRPATSAPKDEWRAYAVAVEQSGGKTQADAEAAVEPLTRDELVKRYGR